VCFRCSTTNPLINNTAGGDCCVACGHPFIRSFTSFDHLPLVEFYVEDGISDDQAIDHIKQMPSSNKRQPKNGNRGGADIDKWQETDHGGGIQTMQMDDNGPPEDEDFLGNEEDLFTRQLMNFEGGGKYKPIRVDAKTMISMKKEEVFVVKSISPGVRSKFYRNMTPDIAVAMCISCEHFFHEEDFEFNYLQQEKCPASSCAGQRCKLFEWQ